MSGFRRLLVAFSGRAEDPCQQRRTDMPQVEGTLQHQHQHQQLEHEGGKLTLALAHEQQDSQRKRHPNQDQTQLHQWRFPSPQPSTPPDNFPDTRNRVLSSAPPHSKPIGIPAISSLRNSLRLDDRIYGIDSCAIEADDYDDNDDDNDNNRDHCLMVNMTTGPFLDSAAGRGRKDSFVSAGPKPISMANPNRDQARQRRESLAGRTESPSSKTPNLMQYGHVPGYGAPNNFGQSSVNSPSALPDRSRNRTVSLWVLAVGDMEMDDAVGHLEMDDTQQRSMQQARQLFGQASRPQLNINASGFTQGLRTSQPTTPAAASFGFQHNPTVSSVNTPTLTTQQPLPSRGSTSFNQSPTGDSEDLGMQLGGSINLNGNDFNLGTTSSNTTSNDSAFCINDPGKHL
ncbi:unnamed protein product [Parascedosporium putredinis]|uniref:Uncharacterized protein n=1 Tax=Parascedosporium putredinis TaxID=1442378 RepID=A0A9P1H850_9PEZI|nr:unnamed protein product [Parascedosporium putredinis]CAI8002062.1 unnamed protein product [Parascedosporium putredinis]